MADTLAFTQDPRRRNLAILAVTAAVLVILAILALIQQSREVAPHNKAEPFLPGLAAQLRNVAKIQIAAKAGTVDVEFKPDRGWVVANHDDFPAAFDHVRQTVVSLAALQTIEPKTARADWLHYLDLDPPPKGEGTEITLQDGEGHVIASVITGKTEDIGDPSGAVGLFVRRSNSTQSWLVRSVYQPKAVANDWLDKQVFDVDLARIRQVDVDPTTGPSFEIRRDKPNVANLNLVDLPKGRELAYGGATDGVASAVTGFSFDDIKPAKGFDFSDGHAARLIAKTFDGLTVTVETIQQNHDYWATVSADATGAKPDVQKQARTIDARASGWAYKLPQYKGQQFMTTLESLLKPLPTKTPSAAPPK